MLDDDVEYWTEVIKTNPNDAEAYFERGKYYSLLENYDSAGADFDEAIRIDLNNAEYYLRRAGTHLQKQEHEEAIVNYTKALSLASDDDEIAEEVYSYRASYMRRMNGDLKGAMDDANEAFSLDSQRADAMGLRALCNAELGDFVAAEADYTEAIRLNANYPANYLRLRAQIRLKLGDTEGAEADRDQVMQLAPEREGRTVRYERAEEALQRGKFNEAFQYLEPLSKTEADFFAYRVLKGDINRGLGNFDAAKQDYDVAIEGLNKYIANLNASKPGQAPVLSQLYEYRGRAEDGRGNVKAAIADYQNILMLKSRACYELLLNWWDGQKSLSQRCER